MSESTRTSRAPAEKRLTYQQWKRRKMLRLARNWVLFLAGCAAVVALLTGHTGTMDTSTMQGMHGAAGVKVKDNKLSVEIQVQTPNAPDTKDAADTSDVAKNISGDSLVAFSGSVGGDINQAWDMLESQPDMVESLKQFGIETMCVGGGQGMAMIIERLS